MISISDMEISKALDALESWSNGTGLIKKCLRHFFRE